MVNKREIDMLNGPIMGKIIVFTIPIILSSLLQLLFNAVDVMVIGKFAGSQSLAAVGSTNSITALFTHLFIGLSIGVNAVVARLIGSNDKEGLIESIHTAIAAAFISGIILVILGTSLCRNVLELMGSPADVIDKSTLYLKICFCGMPAMMVYNFGAAILRAFGDTRRPLLYLMIAGVINVVLNLIFVIAFNMDVEGVALATIISQYISGGCILRCILKEKERFAVDIKKIKIYKTWMLDIIRVGVPSGVSSMLFASSDMVIQSAINSFGSVVMAANSAANSVEGFLYIAMNGVQQAALTFVSQNYGASKTDRIKRTIFCCLGLVTSIGIFGGAIILIFRYSLIGLYSGDITIIEYAISRLFILCPLYFLMGILDTLCGSLRALGYSLHVMIVSIFCICVLRLIYIFTIFENFNTYQMVFIIYPITWTAAIIFDSVILVYGYKKIKTRIMQY